MDSYKTKNKNDKKQKTYTLPVSIPMKYLTKSTKDSFKKSTKTNTEQNIRENKTKKEHETKDKSLKKKQYIQESAKQDIIANNKVKGIQVLQINSPETSAANNGSNGKILEISLNTLTEDSVKQLPLVITFDKVQFLRADCLNMNNPVTHGTDADKRCKKNVFKDVGTITTMHDEKNITEKIGNTDAMKHKVLGINNHNCNRDRPEASDINNNDNTPIPPANNGADKTSNDNNMTNVDLGKLTNILNNKDINPVLRELLNYKILLNLISTKNINLTTTNEISKEAEIESNSTIFQNIKSSEIHTELNGISSLIIDNLNKLLASNVEKYMDKINVSINNHNSDTIRNNSLDVINMIKFFEQTRKEHKEEIDQKCIHQLFDSCKNVLKEPNHDLEERMRIEALKIADSMPAPSIQRNNHTAAQKTSTNSSRPIFGQRSKLNPHITQNYADLTNLRNEHLTTSGFNNKQSSHALLFNNSGEIPQQNVGFELNAQPTTFTAAKYAYKPSRVADPRILPHTQQYQLMQERYGMHSTIQAETRGNMNQNATRTLKDTKTRISRMQKSSFPYAKNTSSTVTSHERAHNIWHTPNYHHRDISSSPEVSENLANVPSTQVGYQSNEIFRQREPVLENIQQRFVFMEQQQAIWNAQFKNYPNTEIRQVHQLPSHLPFGGR